MPAWHPNFRDAEHLPDLKTVRTSFLINVGAVTLVLVLATMIGSREFNLASLNKELDEANQTIEKDKGPISQLVAQNGKFQTEAQKIKEVQDFIAGKFTLSDFLIRLTQTLPPKFGIVNIDYHGKGAANVVGDGSIVLHGSVKDDPATAAVLVAKYAIQWSKDPDFGPLFATVESSDLKKDFDTKRLTFELTMKFKDPNPKPAPKPAETPK